MNSAVKADQWAAIRALCESGTPSLALFAAVSGIDAAVLDERRRKIVARQAGEGATA